MSFTPGADGGGFSVDPKSLRDAAPTFKTASQDTFSEQFLLDFYMQGLVGELLLLTSLSRFATALENYSAKLSMSMHCLANEESNMGWALENAANTYDTGEDNVTRRFKPEPDPIFNPNPIIPIVPVLSFPGFDIQLNGTAKTGNIPFDLLNEEAGS